jgi:hypothetical protein
VKSTINPVIKGNTSSSRKLAASPGSATILNIRIGKRNMDLHFVTELVKAKARLTRAMDTHTNAITTMNRAIPTMSVANPLVEHPKLNMIKRTKWDSADRVEMNTAGIDEARMVTRMTTWSEQETVEGNRFLVITRVTRHEKKTGENIVIRDDGRKRKPGAASTGRMSTRGGWKIIDITPCYEIVLEDMMTAHPTTGMLDARPTTTSVHHKNMA